MLNRRVSLGVSGLSGRRFLYLVCLWFLAGFYVGALCTSCYFLGLGIPIESYPCEVVADLGLRIAAVFVWVPALVWLFATYLSGLIERRVNPASDMLS